MKKLKYMYTSLLLVMILSSCNFPGSANLSTQTTDQDRSGTSVAVTVQVDSTRTPTPTILPILITPAITVSSTSIPLSPNTPAWSAYDYVCELAAGGSTMKMNLAWYDRSESEDGYKVYRDGKVIATLDPNSTYYADVVFVATGKELSYTVEAFSENWTTSTSAITYGCQ
jgi:hypothetical protein